MKPPVPTGSSKVRVLCVKWLCMLLLLPATVVAQNAGLGTTTPDASALFDMVSTSQGLLTPRMTTAQRNAIATPANGLLVFDTDLSQFYYYSSSSGWVGVLNASSLNAAVILSPTTATRNVVQPTGAAIIPLTLKGAVGQTASLLEIQNSGGTTLFSIGSDGSIQLRGSVSGTLGLRATSATTSYNLTFPGAQGTGTLTNDGAGNLSWSSTGVTGSGTTNRHAKFTSASQIGASSLDDFYTTGTSATIDALGNLGIGTLPTQRLDIAGNVRFSGALMPGNAAGTSGQVLISQGASTAPIWQTLLTGNASWSTTGNIGTNPFSNFLGTTDAQGLSIRTNSVERIRVSTGGNIGIGISTPFQPLDVLGNVQFTGSLMPNSTSGTVGQLLVSQGNNVAPIWQDPSTFFNFVSNAWSTTGNLGTSPASNFLGTADAQPLAIRIFNIERLRISTSGNLGIGLTSPTERLDVVGNVQFTGALMPGSTSGSVGQILVSQGAGIAPLWQTPSTASVTGWGLTGNSGTSSINFLGTTDNQPLIVKTNSNEQVRILANGNVGIGTSTATRKLEVNGDVRIGVNGTTIANIIKVTITNYDLIPVAGGSSTTVDFTVTGATPGATVMISPQNALLNGLVISYARVRAADTVEMGVQNVTGTTVDQGAMDFYITVIE